MNASKRRLLLSRETIRDLTAGGLQGARGGTSADICSLETAVTGVVGTATVIATAAVSFATGTTSVTGLVSQIEGCHTVAATACVASLVNTVETLISNVRVGGF